MPFDADFMGDDEVHGVRHEGHVFGDVLFKLVLLRLAVGHVALAEQDTVAALK